MFTDIEGSTKMWERSPHAMHRSLSRHDEILREAIEQHGGYVFKTVGDAFCCAFLTTLDALEAALEAQRALLGEEWEGPGHEPHTLEALRRARVFGTSARHLA
jgi:class 3 adenylate cyclase